MKLADIQERLRELIDAHSEDESGAVVDPTGLVDALCQLEAEIERERLLLGAA